MNKKSLESAIEGALMAHKSAVWWQQEMSSALAELERLDNSNSFGAGTPPPWSSGPPGRHGWGAPALAGAGV